jgi:glycerophosphoryl diester phosphodiesterase
MRRLARSLFLVWSPAVCAQAPVLDTLREAARAAPLVVAHRGASEDWPENTLAALRAAVRAGAQMVEFDVYQTKDGVFVLMHDATCDRTTDAVAKFGRKEVRVDELTLAQIRTLDAGTWKDPRFAAERVPTLEEALAAVFPAVPMIERKGGAAPALVAELRRLEAVDRVLVQAFDWPWLTAVHEAEPRLAVGALGGKELSDARLAEVAVTGARFVHWDHKSLTVESAAAVRARGWPLCTYTVDADLVLLGAAALGCDWITTNRPARLVALRAQGTLAQARPSALKR